ncbi:DUF2460 domain-containing protein [Aureimonas jatrophae]|uniref:TIGR02217 family protein n=1 Tax=Aureimonas jatrophae TaxID=1166073 RepID=A0A1H0CQ85_9HYPH|nr:DUF2460 domain-containing protein [Aureimonas jatrophae]MBB3949336.1 uncharacterized protein (TIGR02217 family) [Aureimonas jatrophae]SDN60072.1 TIGR02217 family protein [Aureimonas jatrophae]
MAIPSFCDERFPLRLSLSTSGGPERRTDIVRLSTGFENRNQRQRHSARRYDAGSGVKALADLALVLDFFEARRGRLVAFRFRDPFDHASARFGLPVTAFDQTLGVGDGQRTEFALVKRYGAGEGAYERPICKPVADTLRVAVGGTQTGAGFALDAATGLLRFDAPPVAGAAVTAGFLFDVPVRFYTDHLAINLAAFEAGEIPTIPLIEVRA